MEWCQLDVSLAHLAFEKLRRLSFSLTPSLALWISLVHSAPHSTPHSFLYDRLVIPHLDDMLRYKSYPGTGKQGLQTHDDDDDDDDDDEFI